MLKLIKDNDEHRRNQQIWGQSVEYFKKEVEMLSKENKEVKQTLEATENSLEFYMMKNEDLQFEVDQLTKFSYSKECEKDTKHSSTFGLNEHFRIRSYNKPTSWPKFFGKAFGKVTR